MRKSVALKTCSLAILLTTALMMGWTSQASAQFSARLFTTGANNEIHFGSGSASWCIHVEPIGGAFDVTNIDACSVRLSSPPNGSVNEISYDCTKTTVVSDSDGNGIQDIQFCFVKTAMHPLFDNLHGNSPKTVTVFVTGNLVTGGSFGGSLTLTLYLKS
jgi:hypothetical protein